MAEQLKAEFLRHLEDKGHDDLWSRLKDNDAVDTVAAKLPPGRKNVSVGGNLDARQKSLLLMAKGNCTDGRDGSTWKGVFMPHLGRLPAPMPAIEGSPPGTTEDVAVQVCQIMADGGLLRLIEGWGVHVQRIRLSQPRRVPRVQRGQGANE
jgi:hypothetical protein